MRHRTRLWPAAAALLAACDAPQHLLAPADRPSAAALAVHGTTRVPFTLTFWSACTAEYVELTGIWLAVYSSTQNANGYRVLERVTFSDLKGEGLSSGTTYVGMSVGTDQRISKGGADGWTWVVTTALLSQGGETNLLGHFTLRYAFGPDGQPTILVDQFVYQCTGSRPAVAAQS